MADEVYEKLREFLDSLPAGFPATESGVEIRILEKLFSPEDAEMALCLTWNPETSTAIAKRCGMEEATVAESLETMARRGLVFRVREADEVLYRAEQYIVGIFEHQFDTMDQELSQLIEEYWPYLAMAWLPNETSQMRVVPVASAFDTTPVVATYDRIRDLIREKEPIGASRCICRMQQAALGNQCNRPTEGCMGFGTMAQYYIDNGWGTRIDSEEALRLLDAHEEAGLVLQTDNAKDISFVCSCCSCCCPGIRLIKGFPNPAELVQSNYRAQIAADLCEECGTCVERCPMEAIVEVEEGVQLDPARCIGCGVCISTCPQEAITLMPKEVITVPPTNYEEVLIRIASERGLA